MSYLYKRITTLTMITLITALAWIYCLSEYNDEPFYIAGMSLAFIIALYALLNAYMSIHINRQKMLMQQTNEALKKLREIMLIDKAIYMELKKLSLVHETEYSAKNQTSNPKNN